MNLHALTFLFSYFVLTLSVAQNNNLFDFVESSRKLKELNKSIRLGARTNICQSISSENSESVLSCTIGEADYQTPIVKVSYESGHIPSLLQSALPPKFIEDTKLKNVSCLFRFKLINDNLSLKNKKKGDDIGRSHGFDVGISCISADGTSTAFTYATELFTKPDLLSGQTMASGIHTMNTKFNSENIFQFLQDNINAGNVTYWKRGVGFINITDQKKWGLLQSTGQQEWFHDVLNKIDKSNATEYHYENGNRDQWGAFVILAIGLQEHRKIGDSCQLDFNADVGVRISTLKDSSTLNLNLQTKFSYQISQNSSLYLRAQSETTRRSTSTVIENTIAAGVKNSGGGYAEVGLTTQNGNRKDVFDSKNYLTGRNDKLIFVRVGNRF